MVLEHHEKQREFSDIIRKIDVPSTFNFANEEDEVILVENLKPFIVFGCRDLMKFRWGIDKHIYYNYKTKRTQLSMHLRLKLSSYIF